VQQKPKDTSANYLVLTKNNYSIVINNYKTKEKYGQIHIKLTKPLTRLIEDYMKLNNLNVGDYLFGSGKLSTYITAQNKKAGINGGINMFRHMKISHELAQIGEDERQALADKMKHSLFVQQRYLRMINTN
jgi:integrase